MAGVPCFEDSCSIVSTVTGNGRIQNTARLDPAGGIGCGTDADPDSGLRLNILGDPAPAAAGTILDCDNLLGTTTDGLAFARRPFFEQAAFSGTKEVIPAGGTSANSVSASITNPSLCSRLVIINCVWTVQYTATGATPEYRSDFVARLEINGVPSIGAELDISGYNTFAPASDQRARQYAQTTSYVLNGGASSLFTMFGTRDATDYGLTMTGGTWNGITARIGVLMLDLTQGDVFTV